MEGQKEVGREREGEREREEGKEEERHVTYIRLPVVVLFGCCYVLCFFLNSCYTYIYIVLTTVFTSMYLP